MKRDLHLIFSLCVALLFATCKPETTKSIEIPKTSTDPYIAGIDISAQVFINKTNTQFFDSNNKQVNVLDFLRDNGVNTIRLRTWYGNNNDYSLQTMSQFAKEIESKGLRTWIDIHYSETWADPGTQTIPSTWKNKPFNEIIDSLKSYTDLVCKTTKPYIIQIGNEINNGFIWPTASTYDSLKFFQSLRACCNQARISSKSSKILIHYAGYRGALSFFWWLRDHNVDFDIAGISYYPKWHGKSLDSLFSTMQSINYYLNKQSIIAETSYPFTDGWNDYTFNPIGTTAAELLSPYTATPTGQYLFFRELVNRSKKLSFASGVCYWEGTWVAYKGKIATDGSPWENQTWFDFNNKALPITIGFK